MSLAKNTSRSVTAMGWHHTVRSVRGVLICEAWDRHGDSVEVHAQTDFELRRATLDAIQLVEDERKAEGSLV
jgi:hypothetical protein